MYLVHSLPLDIDTRNLEENKGEVHSSPRYQSRYSHCSCLRITHPNLPEPGGEGGARRWCSEVANAQKMKLLLKAITEQHEAELNRHPPKPPFFPEPGVCPTQPLLCCCELCPGPFGDALNFVGWLRARKHVESVSFFILSQLAA